MAPGSGFSDLSRLRQCGEEVLRAMVTGGPSVHGGRMPQRMMRRHSASNNLHKLGNTSEA
jgi:hypothetical protein